MVYAIRVMVCALVFGLISAPGLAQPRGGDDDRPRQGAAGMCPWADPDVEVTYLESDDGRVAIEFRSESGTRVEELREFARHVAGMKEGMDPRRGGMHGDGGMGRMMRQMPPVELEAQEVEGGARVIFTPEDPEDFEQLRSQVRDHVERMDEGRCPRMQHR